MGNFYDLEKQLSGRNINHNLFPDLFADQSFSDGCIDGYLTLLDIGFILGDQRIGHLGTSLGIPELYRTQYLHARTVELRFIDNP
jgi:hypothetical protein